MTATLDDARAALDRIADPASGQGLVKAGLVQGLVVRNGRAGFMLEVPASVVASYAPVREAAEKALAALPGVEQAQVVLTAQAAEGATRVRKGAKIDLPRPEEGSEGRGSQHQCRRRRRLCAEPGVG